MIGQISGILIAKQPPEVVIDVNGIGYEVQMPMTSLYELPDVGEPVTLITHFVVREDAQLLYGFNTYAERSLFRQLIKTQGIGPKLAITMMSGLTAHQFVQAVVNEDFARLTKIPGVGRKTAERLVLELADKFKNWGSATPATDAAPVDMSGLQPTLVTNRPQDDALDALIALGYKPAQAEKAIAAALKAQPDAASEDLIRFALKSI